MQLTYTGTSFDSCGAAWAGVIVGKRLAYVKASALAPCTASDSQDAKQCTLDGHACTAGGSAACCSGICSSWFGEVVFSLEGQLYPFKVGSYQGKSCLALSILRSIAAVFLAAFVISGNHFGICYHNKRHSKMML